VNLVPVENQLSSGQPVEQQQRQLQASEAQRFEAEEEMEYVELEDQRRDAQPQRRYLEEQPTDSFESPRYDNGRYRDEPRFNAASNDEPNFEEPRFTEPRLTEPRIQEQRFDDSSLNDEPAPRRAMPASRRPVQKISEPLDVEPIQDDLDDPW
jgi:hypothetical protein